MRLQNLFTEPHSVNRSVLLFLDPDVKAVVSQMYIKFPLLDTKMDLIFGSETDPNSTSVYRLVVVLVFCSPLAFSALLEAAILHGIQQNIRLLFGLDSDLSSRL